MPAITTARMPETCKLSPLKYATYGVRRENIVCTGGSSNRFCTCVASQPTARPTQMPPAATKRNRKLASQRKASGHRGGHRETEGDERSGVVDQALPFENNNDFTRHSQILRDR